MAHAEIEARHVSETKVRKGLAIYIGTFLMLTIVAWCALGVMGYTVNDPNSRFSLLSGEPAFTDFTYLAARVAHFGEPDMLSRTDFKEPFAYPVPSIYAYLFFVRLFPNPLVAYLVFALLSFFVATSCFSLRVKRIAPGWLPQVAVWSTLLLVFPLLFLINRGNIEAVMWVLILLGILAYKRNQMLISAILWALATSMKITPGLLFILFLAKRKYRMFALAITVTIAFSVLALAGVGPTFRQAVSDSSKSAPYLRDTFIAARTSPYFDESLFGASKQIIYLYTYAHGGDYQNRLRHDFSQAPQLHAVFLRALHLYNLLIVPACALLYWFLLRHLPLLNQFIAYIVLGRQASTDRTLVHSSYWVPAPILDRPWKYRRRYLGAHSLRARRIHAKPDCAFCPSLESCSFDEDLSGPPLCALSGKAEVLDVCTRRWCDRHVYGDGFGWNRIHDKAGCRG